MRNPDRYESFGGEQYPVFGEVLVSPDLRICFGDEAMTTDQACKAASNIEAACEWIFAKRRGDFATNEQPNATSVATEVIMTNEQIEAARDQIGLALTLYHDRRAHEDIAKAFVALDALCAAAQPAEQERRMGIVEDSLVSARPEHPERWEALEELGKFILRYFGFVITDDPGWHRVDAETCERLQEMIERFRSLEGK